MQKQASKTAAKLAQLAETVETFIGDVHFEKATDPLNRLTLSLDKLLSLPSVTGIFLSVCNSVAFEK